MAKQEGDVQVIRDGLTFKRYFTTEGRHPFDDVEWETRDAVIPNFKEGGNAFEQRDVEFPVSWSQNATNIVAQKYFRGTLGTPQRETSVRQLAGRVVDTIRGWGEQDGYFESDRDAQVFSDELTHLIVTQKAAFNSPVWFNVGVPDTPQQCSACFILAVDDHMSSILNWYVEEGTIFKGGSGSGINLSRIRSSKESLAGGGTASGPVSFMRGADASAGTIKSGGKTRRAAKMVILNVDHPDVRDFIWCKANEERKARALRDAGFDMDLDGKDSASIQYQNANNSVRVTDEFMRAFEQDQDWKLKAITTGRDRRDRAGTRPDARDRRRRVAVRRSRHAVRHHDQRVAHLPGVGPDQRIQPVQRVHAPGQQRLQPRVAEPDEVHGDGRLVRRRELQARRRDRVHRPGDPGRQLELPDRARSARTRAPTASSASGYANLGALLMARGLPYDSDGGPGLGGRASPR